MRFILCVCFNYTQKLFIHLSLLLTTCLSVQRPTATIPDYETIQFALSGMRGWEGTD